MTGFHVAEAGLKLLTLLSLSPKLDYRYVHHIRLRFPGVHVLTQMWDAEHQHESKCTLKFQRQLNCVSEVNYHIFPDGIYTFSYFLIRKNSIFNVFLPP